jgi:hypothetical protein
MRRNPAILPIALAAASLVVAVSAKQIDPPVVPGRDGRLVYKVDARGDRIVDFSHAGYRGGGVPLPVAAVRVVVPPVAGDNNGRLQAAIDFVSGLAPDAQGLRGAVQLTAGRYEIAGRLRMAASGVVLRGAGPQPDGTVLVAAGTDRRPLIELAGRAGQEAAPAPVSVVDAYVPVGATRLRLAGTAGLAAGTAIVIERPSSKEWIEMLGMHEAPGRQPFEWKPGTLNVRWERTVTAVAGDTITLDAPLTVALDAEFGGGTVARFNQHGRIENSGVENLRCESAFDAANPCDEEHAWTAIHVDAARDVWVTDVTGLHFAGSLVYVGADAARVTVQDCASLAPVSENGGYRRMTFHTAGQQTLFHRCRSEQGRHDFSTGHLAAGPNVFLECTALAARSFSGSTGSWSSGILLDNVSIDGEALRLDNLETWNQGTGWAAANSMIWQSSAGVIVCRTPPGAMNWAVGPWAQFAGDGRWAMVNEFVRPDSLYRAQLAERVGPAAGAALGPRRYAAPSAGGPMIVVAMPDLAVRLAPHPPAPGKPLALADGWLVADGGLLTGREDEVPYWRGSTLPARAPEIGPALTRFVPDRTGPGLTDDLATLTDAMRAAHQVALRHHWGLWYDRRRDDHERIRRPDGDVWPPFFEQPWVRSGRDTASNGLSRYDLSRFSPWYFGRLREFAGLAREKGLVLINEMYFQHNILEAGAHWAEFPWRTANNVQDVGFPEPPPYKETDGSEPPRPEYGKRIFMAEAFYDVSHPVRRALHRAYIRQCLANLADQPNVIHTTGDEYSGPLHFVQFWLDVVTEWEAETGRHPLIALSAPKDVQDAILADPVRNRPISVIDLNYWWRTDTDLYAPRGGQNLAPRQHERLWKGGRPSAASLARMAREYREKFPDKAIITGLDQPDGWAFAAAGGSLPALPAATDPGLLAALPRLRPVAGPGGATDNRQWALAEPGAGYFAVALGGGPLTFDLRAAAGTFRVRRLDPATGRIAAGDETVTAGRMVTIDAPRANTTVVWLSR